MSEEVIIYVFFLLLFFSFYFLEEHTGDICYRGWVSFLGMFVIEVAFDSYRTRHLL